MPQYRVTERSYFENRMVEPGTIVDYDGLPGKALEPLDKAGEAKKKEWEKSRKPRDANEAMGYGMALGMAKANKAKDTDEDEESSPVKIIQVVGDAGLTTIGHSSMSQKSAGGNDAQHLYEPDGKGGLVPQNPHDPIPGKQKADSPDDGAPKVDKTGAPAKGMADGSTTAVKAKAK